VLPRIDTSWQESRIPICDQVLQGDDEGFHEGGFVASCQGYGGFIAHKNLAGVGVTVVFWWQYSSIV
jgi:hypothetical protein